MRQGVGAGPAEGRPDLSVIVVTWNCLDLVLDALAAVEAGSGDLAVEVILVDNASADGTVDAVEARFPSARVVANRENVGYPRANNQGLALASGRHVLFLNPDTEVATGTLERCVAELDAHPELGAVGCKALFPDGSTQVECARRHYRLRHLLWEAFYLHVVFPQSPVFAHQVMGDWDHEGDRDVEALVGAFMMVRREAALEIGGMPDEVFMYHEDLAFCLRLEKKGWGVRYLGSVSMLHHHRGSSSRSRSPLELLEGEVRVRLVRERSGLLAGAAARVLFGVRQLCRLAAAIPFRAVPSLRRRYPQVAAVGKQATLLAWTVAPGVVHRRLRRSGIPADERPRLLLVGPTPPPVHGVSVYFAMLLASMELRTRFRVHHVELADRRDLDNLGRLDLRNVVLGLRHAVEVTAATWRHRADVCYLSLSQNPLAFARDAALIAGARSGGARVVAHVHGGYLDTLYRGASRPFRAFMRATLRMVARGWVLGESLQRLFQGLLPAERVRVVPNGVPEGPATLSEPETGGDRPALTVLYMGQVCETKGVGDLLDAVERLGAEGRDVHCLVAGGYLTERDRAVLQPRLAELEARGTARALGVVRGAEKARAFGAADVLALPSRYPLEGQPLVVLEAMAAGLPVVSTPRAAIPDMVVDGETGILVPEGDVEALGDALARLADDAELRGRMGCAGLRRHRAHFTGERCVARVVEELEHALG